MNIEDIPFYTNKGCENEFVCVWVCDVCKWSQLAHAVPLSKLGKGPCSGASDAAPGHGATWQASMQ